MTFKAFWAGCWFGHQEPIWQHDHLTCLTCGTRIDVLPQTLTRGPAHDPEPVRGQPTGRAVKSGKVSPLKRRVS